MRKLPRKRTAALLVLAAMLMAAPPLAGCAGGGEEYAMVYYVKEGGGENAAGTKSDPFGSIIAARDAIREYKRTEGLPEGGIAVKILSGEYGLKETLAFTAEDSGSENCTITYCADEGRVHITGGVTLSEKDFGKLTDENRGRVPASVRDAVRVCDLAAMGYSAQDWGKLYAYGAYSTASKYDGDTVGPLACELFYNGERMTVARWPNGAFTRIDSVKDNGECSEAYIDGATVRNEAWDELRNPRGGTFSVDAELSARIKTWQSVDDAWLFGYFKYDWAEMTTPVAAADPEAGTVSAAYSSVYGYTSGARFYVFNVPEELDAPGEWYLDREKGLLYFYPPENTEGAEISLSLSKENLVSVSDAEYLTFKDLSFSGTRADGLVMKGSHLTVSGCTVTGVAGTALSMDGMHNLADNNEISHIGGSGIVMSGGDRQTLTRCESAATNNLVSHWSEVVKTYRPAIGASGVGVTIAYNEMHTAPHLAVSYGGNDHLIEYNDIHDVCSETVDGGAIYSGRDWTQQGTVIRYNFFHDINADIGNPVALYFDDALSGQTAFGNVFCRVKGIGILAGGGRDIKLTNNVFVEVGTPIAFDARAREGFVNNGWFAHMVVPEDTTLWTGLAAVPYTGSVWAAKYPTLARLVTDRSDPDNIDFPCNPSYNLIDNNVTCRCDKYLGEINEAVINYGELGETQSYEKGDDPGFTDEAANIYSFREDAKVLSELEGFENIPFDRIGRNKAE